MAQLNYHLTEAGAAASVGVTDLAPGHYPATELQPADAYVAPGDYVEEWGRRRLDFSDPQSDACVRAAIEAHRAGEALPTPPEAGTVRWAPPAPPLGGLPVEYTRRRGVTA